MGVKQLLLVGAFLFGCLFQVNAQDTTVVQTLTFDSTSRSGTWVFPADTGQTYRKIIMQYRMRCHNAAVGNGNVGCREWDYSCNTLIRDSSQVDSAAATHPSHLIGGYSGSSFPISNGTTYTYYDYDQYLVNYSAVLAETTATVGAGAMSLNAPFTASIPEVKTQYLWTANELTAAGLSAGNLTSLRMDVNSLGSNLNFLRVGIKATTKTLLDADDPDVDGFTPVYFTNTTFPATGLQNLNFYNPFAWDGTSNIIVEFSFLNAGTGTDNAVNGMALGMDMGLQSTKEEYYLDIPQAGGADMPTNSLSGVSNEITISFWSYGADALPQNTTVFEGVDAASRRQANVHLPWNNSRVYWDCGNDGSGYDRIDFAANAADFEGRWTHWAFTKNVTTGTMNIYIDGQLAHTGSGRTRPITLSEFRLGGAINSTLRYNGKIDEFRIWNAELSQSVIQDWMNKDITASHPNYANLQAYYPMDGGSGMTLADASPNNFTANILGGAAWRQLRGNDYYRNFAALQTRPNVTFVKGTYTQTTTVTTIRDSIPNPLYSVEGFEVQGTDLVSQGTSGYNIGGWQYVYDESGAVTDSILAPTDSTINVSTIDYFRKADYMDLEIMSFVTPYGNGLDLGPDGVMWEFDVTDFEPALHGSVFMYMNRGGQFQEEMDIRFLMIEGTPPRDVKSIRNIWPIPGVLGQPGNNYANYAADLLQEPRDVALPVDEDAWKIRTMVTGHGQEGEFIPRTHYMNIDGGSEEWVWQAWTECSEVPVYPQGGTWLFDRAGWCPGDPTDLEEFALDGLATAGDTVNIDYGIFNIANPGDSRYITSHLLVGYGAPNFSLNAAVENVKVPTDRTRYARYNPACSEPVVIIKNEGSTTLTSLDIIYNVQGGTSQTFSWTGSLGFLETEEVTLPLSAPTFWNGGTANVFEVQLANPNGGMDEQPENDVFYSPFEPWATYMGGLVLNWRTNLNGSQTTWRVYNDQGAIVAQNTPFLGNNTTYQDELNLPAGCYKLRFNDAGDNGLYYWFTPQNGTGYARITEYGQIKVIFEPEFGGFFEHSFWTDGLVNGEEVTEVERLSISPNPSEGRFKVEMEGFSAQELHMEVYDLQGKRVWQSNHVVLDGSPVHEEIIDLSDLSRGQYLLKIWNGERLRTRTLQRL